jgi:hypothetical protein
MSTGLKWVNYTKLARNTKLLLKIERNLVLCIDCNKSHSDESIPFQADGKAIG